MRKTVKRALAMSVAVVMLFTVMSVGMTAVSAASYFQAGLKLFFKPTSKWLANDAVIYAHCTGSGDEWIPMEDIDKDGYYKGEVPYSGMGAVRFASFGSGVTDFTESKATYKSSKLSYDGVNNCYTLGSSDTSGSWSQKEDTWIYFTNNTGWEHVMVYLTTPTDNAVYSSWPGAGSYLVNEKYEVHGIDPMDYEYIVFNFADDGMCTKRIKVSELVGKCTNVVTDKIYDSAYLSYTDAQKNIESGNGFVPKENPVIALAGSFNNWSTTTDIFYNPHDCDYTYSIDLEQGTHTFKLVYDGLWYGGSGSLISNATTEDFTLSPSKGNLSLWTTGGKITFVYNVTDQRLTVRYNDGSITKKEIYIVGDFNNWSYDKYMTAVPLSMSYYKPCSSECTGLIEALESIGVDSSKENRMIIAIENQMFDYSYTAEQNTELLNLLKEGKLINPDRRNSFYVEYYIKEGFYNFKVDKYGTIYSTSAMGVHDYTTYDLQFFNSSAPTYLFATGGTYRFFYNYRTDQMCVEVEYDVEPADKAKVTLSGSFNNWTTKQNMTKVDSERVAITLELKPGDYEFKIVHNDVWYGKDIYVEDSVSCLYAAIEGDNYKFRASGGIYTFTYNVLMKTMAISYDMPKYDSEVYLVGDFNGWNKKDCKMTELYAGSKSYSCTVELKKGIYYFKVVKDDLWYGNGILYKNTTSNQDMYFTGDNCVLNATGGTYTFMYNVVTDELSINYKGNATDEADLYKVSLAGDFNSWNTGAAPMTKVSSDTVSTKVVLKAGTYQYKIVKDAYWYGKEVTVHDATSGVVLSCVGGNCTLKATGGEYTFTYNVASDTLKITVELDERDPADLCSVNLAGSFNSWSTSATKMTKTSSTAVSATVSLKAGSYPFKIVKDNFWYGNGKSFSDKTSGSVLSYTGGDCTLVASGGDYTFTYDVAADKLSITYVPSTEDLATNATAALSGDFNSWSTTASKMTYHSANKLAVTVPLDYGTYQFKIVYDSLWYGNSQEINDKTSSDLQLSPTSTECVINAQGGNYTFIFDVSTNKLKVTAELVEKDYASDAVVSISGDFNEWTTNTNVMYASEKNVVSGKVSIPAGSHLFKIVHDGLWYGSSAEIFDQTTSALELTTADGECKIHAKGGEYEFRYNVLDHTLTVVHVEEVVDYTKDAKVYLAGDFNGWNQYATPMKAISDKEVSVDYYLAVGSYKFKIVNNDVWFGNTGAVITDTIDRLPTSNTATDIVLEATKAGTYTFTYNVVNDNIGVSYTSGDAAESASVYLSGDFNNWSKDDAMKYEGSGVFAVTKTLSAGEYCFKVVEDDLWYGNGGTIENTTTTSSGIGWEMSMSEGDCKLNAKGGSYTFRYNVNTNFLQVVYNG